VLLVMSEAPSRPTRTRMIVGIGLVVLLTRFPALWLSSDGFLFNVDELELVRSVVDRFLGLPSTTLAWPASPLQMAGVVFVAFGAVLAPVTSPSALADYLSRLYLDAGGLLAGLRLLTTIVMSIAFASYFAQLRAAGRGRLFSIGTTLVFATTPLAFIYSTQAVGDGLAFSLLLLSGLWLDRQSCDRREVVAGALFGLALACKFTVALALPLIVAMLVSPARNDRSRMRALLAFVAAAAIALVLACPYLWLDPMRLAKSTLGNIGRAGDALGFASASWQLLSAVSAPMAVLGLTGLARLSFGRRLGVALGGGASIVLLLVITANAGVVYDRYYLPGLAVAGLLGLHAPWQVNAGRLDRALLSVCILIFASANAIGYLMQIDERRDEARGRLEVRAGLEALPAGTPVLLPLRDLIEFPVLASSSSLLRVADNIDRATHEGASWRALSGKAGFTPETARILAPAFNEDERALAARLRAMAGREPRPGLEMIPWYPDGARFGIVTLDEALVAYRASEHHHLVTPRDGDCTDYLYLGREGRGLGGLCLYFSGSAPERPGGLPPE
jgi:hypothetical protein